jgi:hypothetical protein
MPENLKNSLHDLILVNGWQQGSLALPSNFGIEIGTSECVLIAVTQTCDLAQESLDKEPEVEFVLAQIVAKKVSHFENLKNPRILQVSHDAKIYEISLKKRYFFAREKLRDIVPFACLNINSLRTLQDFMARRYRRPAYADEFNKRWQRTKMEKEISKQLTELSDLLKMLLVSSDITIEKPHWIQEKPEENTYQVDFIGILYEEKTESERKADEILQILVENFKKCGGIKATGEIKLERELLFLDYFNSLIWDADANSSVTGKETVISKP